MLIGKAAGVVRRARSVNIKGVDLCFRSFANVSQRERIPKRRCTCRHALRWLFQNILKHGILLTCIFVATGQKILSLVFSVLNSVALKNWCQSNCVQEGSGIGAYSKVLLCAGE